jgi:ABC-2 type transport system permease protein
LKELEDGDIRAVLAIPGGLGTALESKQPTDITLFYDPSQTTSSQIILASMREAFDEIDRQITRQPALLQVQEQSVQSQSLRNIDYLVPGIIAMSVMILGLFGSLTLVERREKKILKRFAATPVTRSTMLSSQVVYRLILAVVQTLIILLIARFAFDVQVAGSWLALIGWVLLGTLVFISMGYLAVSRSRTTEGAMPIIQLLQFPMLFLSGIFFPVEFFPDFMKPIVAVIPVTYLGDALRQVMADATPLYSLTTDAAVLIGWLVACMVLAIRFFKWE